MARGSSAEHKSLSTLSATNQLVSVLNTPAASTSPSPDPRLQSTTMVGRKSNVRRSPQTEITMPVTYTPTTHRISKAKKGKRVHACEHPGCNKVFTRAEHRRRHELNHNPEASYRCTHHGCKKAFHRPDLLARHMERHELESQPEQAQWSAQAPAPVVNESASIPRCVPMDTGSLLASSQQSHSMSIGSLVAPGVHPDLANDCSLMWNGMDLPLQQPRPTPNMFHQLPESADDSPFYSSPAETCPSPLSDAAFSLPPHSSSSISSASVSVIDQYPKGILKTEMHSSPMQMHSPLRWDGSDAGMPPSHLVPISLDEHLIQPPVQCHYPSPSWSSADCLPYEDHVQSLAHFQPMGWKQWAM
ncbi:Zinc finger C2H2 [Penicillium hispanicum]|uniref:Zinc finger C2H2 n=1 Tax=Penicillium hispanicum TaxID=1080232 RepID=UPI00253F8E96|nr:Zinc finger C2H2 [Penicillium hispanicum]KAJ5570513.1 Zinc finger C2H2 [Penicillium hispanicum]